MRKFLTAMAMDLDQERTSSLHLFWMRLLKNGELPTAGDTHPAASSHRSMPFAITCWYAIYS